METQTDIRGMMTGIEIIVPNYQRAYSWDTPKPNSTSKTQTDVFWNDIQEYMKTDTRVPYYFGHFLFEKKGKNEYAIVDGQQRLTTIVIFLAVIFKQLQKEGPLTEKEQRARRLIQDGSTYGFSTVDYDNQKFRDYVINNESINKNNIETLSLKRIVNAYDYFENELSRLAPDELKQLLEIVLDASCTTHVVQNEVEAIQMFIFQNDRGKHPSKLEVLKAHFMYHLFLVGGDRAENMVKEVQNRFVEIYKNLSYIEDYIDEDDVLQYALRIDRNTLQWINIDEYIYKELIKAKEESCQFVLQFAKLIQYCTDALKQFYINDAQNYIDIHSLIVLGAKSIFMPFIIKAYKYNVSKDELCKLCRAIESITLRDKVIGTRADITSRLRDEYKNFNEKDPCISKIVERIDYLKNAASSNWWWAYWNAEQFKNALNGVIDRPTAKYILWKYENYLRSRGHRGYTDMWYSMIERPELEHIAPQNPSENDPIVAGYCDYDDEFKNEYLNCLGNYLLLSKSHNSSISNGPFENKRQGYTHLEQQREIQEMTKDDIRWDKEKISARKRILIDFILNNL